MSVARELQLTLPDNLAVETLLQPGYLPTLATRSRDINDLAISEQVWEAYVRKAAATDRYRTAAGNGYVYMCGSEGHVQFNPKHNVYDAL